MLLRLLHYRELEDLCLNSQLVLINSFDSVGSGPGATKIILSDLDRKFLNSMGSSYRLILTIRHKSGAKIIYLDLILKDRCSVNPPDLDLFRLLHLGRIGTVYGLRLGIVKINACW